MTYKSHTNFQNGQKNILKKIIAACVIFNVVFGSLLLTNTSYASGAKTEIPPVTDTSIEPKAYILVDATSGAIIKSKNEHEAMPVASVSKIITALGAINTIEATKQIIATQEAQDVEPNKIGMSTGEIWLRDDLLNCLLLISANDAAYALATASAGSIEEFQVIQNSIARNLGMKDSSFGDPSGLDDALAKNGATAMSAYDVAIGARALLNNPELAAIVTKPNYQFTGGDGEIHILTNHNDTLLSGYAGSNGIKTGYTQKSGRTLVSSATRDGQTVIAVVLDVQETDQWAASLMDEGFEYLTNAVKDKTDLTKAKDKLPEIRPISTEANLTILNEPKSGNSSIDKSSAKKSEVNTVSNYLSIQNISIFIVLLIIFVIYLRIKSVKKLRLKRKKEHMIAAELQRRKMLDVIDLTNDGESELISKK